jgi:hypothetical protein
MGMGVQQRKQDFSMQCVLMDMMENEVETEGVIAHREAKRRLDPTRELASHQSAAANVLSGLTQNKTKKQEIPQVIPKQQGIKVRKVIKGDSTVARMAGRAAAQDGHVRVDNRPVRVRKTRLT